MWSLFGLSVACERRYEVWRKELWKVWRGHLKWKWRIIEFCMSCKRSGIKEKYWPLVQLWKQSTRTRKKLHTPHVQGTTSLPHFCGKLYSLHSYILLYFILKYCTFKYMTVTFFYMDTQATCFNENVMRDIKGYSFTVCSCNASMTIEKYIFSSNCLGCEY